MFEINTFWPQSWNTGPYLYQIQRNWKCPNTIEQDVCKESANTGRQYSQARITTVACILLLRIWELYENEKIEINIIGPVWELMRSLATTGTYFCEGGLPDSEAVRGMSVCDWTIRCYHADRGQRLNWCNNGLPFFIAWTCWKTHPCEFFLHNCNNVYVFYDIVYTFRNFERDTDQGNEEHIVNTRRYETYMWNFCDSQQTLCSSLICLLLI